MGRHSADDGAGVDPLVAAALEQRHTPAGAGEPRHGREARGADGTPGGLGWPGEPADGTGLGWPADDTAAGTDTSEPAPRPAEEPPARRKLGWRRLFGGSAPEAARGGAPEAARGGAPEAPPADVSPRRTAA